MSQVEQLGRWHFVIIAPAETHRFMDAELSRAIAALVMALSAAAAFGLLIARVGFVASADPLTRRRAVRSRDGGGVIFRDKGGDMSGKTFPMRAATYACGYP